MNSDQPALPLPDLQTDPCSADGTLTDYYSAGSVQRIVAQRDEHIARLQAELETERMRVVACGVIAMANTEESAKKVRQIHPDYWCASVQDVAKAVDREMALRAEVDALRAKRVPLTDAMVTEIAEACGYDGAVPTVRLAFAGFSVDKFARAIERAHGIDAARAEAKGGEA